jgi:EcsC protein family
VAPRLGLAFAEKALAQAAPLLGAFSGGAINYMFTDYFQQVAGVHFTLRRLERTYANDECVRACFDHLVRQARQRRQLKPTAAAA